MRTTVIILLLAGVLPAQPFTFGLKAGAMLTSDMDSYYATSGTKRYTIGPMITAGLPLGFRFEFNALYRRAGYTEIDSSIFGTFVLRARGDSWEFPLVLRHKLRRGLYVGAGYAPRVINGNGRINQIINSINGLPATYETRDAPGEWEPTHGVLGEAGIEKRIGPLRIAPEVRYTFWNHPSVEVNGSRGFYVATSQHQVDLLVGITF